jgi:hypothetical protein
MGASPKDVFRLFNLHYKVVSGHVAASKIPTTNASADSCWLE